MLSGKTKRYKTKEDFARGFVPAFKQALNIAERRSAGKEAKNDGIEWISDLMAEAEELKKERKAGGI